MPLSACIIGSASIDGGSRALSAIARIYCQGAETGLLYHWGSRYRTLDPEIGQAVDGLVTALGGTLGQPGMYALREGTPMSVAAIAHLIGWVTIVEVEEP